MPAPAKNPLVLFLCSHNSTQSQMAEALLRWKADDQFEVGSAGLYPKPIHPFTVQVLDELGILTQDLAAKPMTEFLGKAAVRYAIIVGEKGDRACPRIYPFAGHTFYWPFDDPAAFAGTSEQVLDKFREVRDDIAARIEHWLDGLYRHSPSSTAAFAGAS